jgi:predicted short-subunit dehydrogenase-like oxidoreductase (DUF2520 family)
MLAENGHELCEVWSHTSGNAVDFALQHHCIAVESPGDFSIQNELIIIAVNDSNISTISDQINPDLQVVHTSGTVPLAHLKQNKRGVVWPLFSLTKGVVVDYQKMPLLIETTDDTFYAALHRIFKDVSSTIQRGTSSERKATHLAAVFANNFTNQMYVIAKEILADSHIKFDLLMPLILQGAEKLQTMQPGEAQTGPARRADFKTIEAHQLLLANNPDLLAIYNLMTSRILKAYHDKKL